MQLYVQVTMCILFITIFGNILPLAVFGPNLDVASTSGEDSIQRVRRQGPIVQPSWILNSEVSLFQDYNVRVTDEKLEETEAIRDYIHETVDNGTYVVELDEGDFEEEERQLGEIPVEELSHPEPEVKVESNSNITPAPMPEPMPEPIPEPMPAPVIKHIQQLPPKEKQPNESQQARVPSESSNKSKTLPKTSTAPSSSRFLIWLRKRFNHS